MKRDRFRLLVISLTVAVGLACRSLALPGIPPDATPLATGLGSTPGSATPPAGYQASQSPEIPAATALSITDTQLPEPTPTETAIRFAVIGDYGEGGQAEADVARLIEDWKVDFILTVGDNNYPSGGAVGIDRNIGQFYHDYIYPYQGAYGAGAEQLRFFPTLGNHDWDTNRAQAYFNYFELPGNERYYDFFRGAVHFFALDTDSREPDGVGRSSSQADWLRDRLAAATETWKIVYGHHPPFSSGLRGSVDWMRWPFKEWGATIYLAGHDHFYERLEIEGMTYVTNGLGGGPIYDLDLADSGSFVRFNDDYGAMLVVADESQISFQFITRLGVIVDEFQFSNHQP